MEQGEADLEDWSQAQEINKAQDAQPGGHL